jgi:hypothetical protein
MLAVVIGCVVGLSMSAVVVVDSFLPGGPRLPDAAMVLALIGVFPVWGAVLWKITRGFRSNRITRQDLFKLVNCIPLRVKVAASIIVGLGMVNALIVFTSWPTGQPEMHAESYFLNSHGQRTLVSEAEYLRAVATVHRGFAGHASMFYAIAGALACGAWVRRRESPASQT